MLYEKITTYRTNSLSNRLSDAAMKGLGGIFSWLYDIISMVLLEVEDAACIKSELSCQ